jgi:hypothetical protein
MEKYPLAPVIEPVEGTIPPDVMVHVPEEDEE